jgi:DNA-binding transcriptional ArsR family regulator
MRVAKALSLAELIGVLSERARLEILLLLWDGERSPGELVALTGLASPTVSHHLRTLRLHGLVGVRRVHRNLFYQLAGAEVTGAAASRAEDGEGDGEGAGLMIRGRDGCEVCLRRRVEVGHGGDGEGLGTAYRQVRGWLGTLAPFVWAVQSS